MELAAWHIQEVSADAVGQILEEVSLKVVGLQLIVSEDLALEPFSLQGFFFLFLLLLHQILVHLLLVFKRSQPISHHRQPVFELLLCPDQDGATLVKVLHLDLEFFLDLVFTHFGCIETGNRKICLL